MTPQPSPSCTGITCPSVSPRHLNAISASRLHTSIHSIQHHETHLSPPATYHTHLLTGPGPCHVDQPCPHALMHHALMRSCAHAACRLQNELKVRERQLDEAAKEISTLKSGLAIKEQ